ncbi:GNAT family N-acetyltransferase [Asticcacaulis sp. BYS171W]|uniref:GNAT family N-acetyltransferase n=1 Tax=Asticcacaulis aquaticus TaxID=2984212 RepID=A0ABT5HPW1_9CAUL|nr:GNAT family N-acetyltransferase [Asticcacaulis aquaticus]MDC7682091.1 GNAT family N-acetyltransferase [Asticcacaulis aquaticus]
MSLPALTVALHRSISEIDATVWDGLKDDDNPFNSHAFLETLEQTDCVGEASGWLPHHLSLSDETGAIRGVMPLYLKLHSMGEYVFDHSWAQAYERAGGRYYPKLLSAAPFTPVTGARLLSPDPDIRRALIRAAVDLTDNNGLSSLHINFPTDTEWEEMGEAGLLLRQDQQFWWDNNNYNSFDDFLGALSANRRKVIRRERRDVQAALDLRVITGDDITETHLDQLHAFIENTYDRKWGAPYLTRDFFSLITERMRERIILVFAYDGDEAVAGAINYVGGDTLYGRQWGATVEVPFLHFEVCYYQAIDYAIAHGLKRVEAGTQGEHKISRGYLPHSVYSAHHIRDEALRAPVARYLLQERMAVMEQMQRLEAEGSPFKKA